MRSFIVLQHDLFQITVDLARGFTLQAAEAHEPPFDVRTSLTHYYALCQRRPSFSSSPSAPAWAGPRRISTSRQPRTRPSRTATRPQRATSPARRRPPQRGAAAPWPWFGLLSSRQSRRWPLCSSVPCSHEEMERSREKIAICVFDASCSSGPDPIVSFSFLSAFNIHSIAIYPSSARMGRHTGARRTDSLCFVSSVDLLLSLLPSVPTRHMDATFDRNQWRPYTNSLLVDI